MSNINVIAYDIDYDTDGEEVSLPLELSFSFDSSASDEEIHDSVSDQISTQTGFCHKGFRLRRQDPDSSCNGDDTIERLFSLGSEATQDEWRVQEGNEGAPDIWSGDKVIIGCEGFWSDMEQDYKNAEYIAAARPQVIIPLLLELQALRKQKTS